MNNKKIILLTGNNDFFGQTRKPWVSMDTNKLQNKIREHGFEVEKYSFHQIFNQKLEITNSIIFYTFSQKVNRRDYIKDVVQYLDNGTNFLIPSYDLLLCHENKGFQELYKRKINVPSLNANYFSHIEQVFDYPIRFPVVLKTVDTSNGKGVFLVENQQDLVKRVRQLEKQNILIQLDLVRRKYFRRKKSYPHYPDYRNRTDYYQYKDYILKDKNFILQEFVPGLKHDYRVLIFYDKYYVMKRYTKKNDFRASGTKIQEYDIEIDDKLLNYAREIFQKFNTPILSIDVGTHQDKYCLFEFQALHFGINVLIKSSGFYKHENERWNFKHIEKKPGIESELAYALAKYLNAHYSS